MSKPNRMNAQQQWNVNRNLQLLTSSWFLMALIILLVNDFLLKEIFHNWLTGKLSDFAGLFVFALFWTALFPHRKRLVFLSTFVFFIWWKSSFSQGFIDGWNEVGFIQIARVIDYSDLLALLILPLAWFVESKEELQHNFNLHPALPILVSAFAFAATSNVNPYKTTLNSTFFFPYPIDTLRVPLLNFDAQQHPTFVDSTILIRDTVNLGVPSKLCPPDVTATLILKRNGNSGCSLKVLEVWHECKNRISNRSGFLKEVKENLVWKVR